MTKPEESARNMKTPEQGRRERCARQDMARRRTASASTGMAARACFSCIAILALACTSIKSTDVRGANDSFRANHDASDSSTMADSSVGKDRMEKADSVFEEVPEEENVCQPQCGGKQCGPDGCGGSCGVCPCEECSPNATACIDEVCVPQNGECCDVVECLASCGADKDCMVQCGGTCDIEVQMANNTFIYCLDQTMFFQCSSFVQGSIPMCLSISLSQCASKLPSECLGTKTCADIDACVKICENYELTCYIQCIDQGSESAKNSWAEWAECLVAAGFVDCMAEEEPGACREQSENSCQEQSENCVETRM